MQPFLTYLIAFTSLTSLALASPQFEQKPQDSESKTPAMVRILAARKAIEVAPKNPRHHNALALGLARRARETADPDYYDQAAKVLETSLELAPDNLEARKLQTWLLLGQHRWAAALRSAQVLQKRVPDDVLVYGFLVDANVELGRYAEAEVACQWMLDLRPGNVPGLTRASYLRELFGEVQGAVDLLVSAFHATRSNEKEDLAWIQTHIGHLEHSRGDWEKAEQALTRALVLFPDYHYALKQLADVRSDQGRFEEAASLLAKRLELAPHPENAFHLALALHSAGQPQKAALLFKRFETGALEESESADNANRELITFYSDERFANYRSAGTGPQDALRLARAGIATSGNLYAQFSLGEALLAAGQPADALVAFESALGVGLRDARLAYLAGRAALASGEEAYALELLQNSLDVNRKSAHAQDARKLMLQCLEEEQP